LAGKRRWPRAWTRSRFRDAASAKGSGNPPGPALARGRARHPRRPSVAGATPQRVLRVSQWRRQDAARLPAAGRAPCLRSRTGRRPAPLARYRARRQSVRGDRQSHGSRASGRAPRQGEACGSPKPKSRPAVWRYRLGIRPDRTHARHALVPPPGRTGSQDFRRLLRPRRGVRCKPRAASGRES